MLKALTARTSDSNRVRFKREHETSSRVRGTDKAAKTWAKRLRMNKDNEYRENAGVTGQRVKAARTVTKPHSTANLSHLPQLCPKRGMQRRSVGFGNWSLNPISQAQ